MKNVRIFWQLVQINLKKSLIYRTNFWITLVGMTLWMGLYLVFFETLFSHVQEVSGWNRGEMIILLSFYYYIMGLANVFYKDSFEEFSSTVRQGRLDGWLIRPVSTELMCFFEVIRVDHLLDLALAGIILMYDVQVVGQVIRMSDLILGLITGLMGAWLLYSLLLLVASLVLALERLDGAGSFIWNVTQTLRYPRQIYTGSLKVFMQFILPIALIASVPAEIARGSIDSTTLIYFLVACVAFYALGRTTFYFTLKRYQSAN